MDFEPCCTKRDFFFFYRDCLDFLYQYVILTFYKCTFLKVEILGSLKMVFDYLLCIANLSFFNQPATQLLPL